MFLGMTSIPKPHLRYTLHAHMQCGCCLGRSDLKRIQTFMSSIELDALQQGNTNYPQSHIGKKNHKLDLFTI